MSTSTAAVMAERHHGGVHGAADDEGKEALSSSLAASNTSNNSDNKQQQQQQQTQQLDFCWYWYDDQYWWPALYFDSIHEARTYCVPLMKQTDGYATSATTQKLVQTWSRWDRREFKKGLKKKMMRGDKNKSVDDDSSYKTPCVALIDAHYHYWIIPLLSLSSSKTKNKQQHILKRGDLEFGGYLLECTEQAKLAVQDNAPLARRLQGALEHLFQLYYTNEQELHVLLDDSDDSDDSSEGENEENDNVTTTTAAANGSIRVTTTAVTPAAAAAVSARAAPTAAATSTGQQPSDSSNNNKRMNDVAATAAAVTAPPPPARARGAAAAAQPQQPQAASHKNPPPPPANHHSSPLRKDVKEPASMDEDDDMMVHGDDNDDTDDDKPAAAAAASESGGHEEDDEEEEWLTTDQGELIPPCDEPIAPHDPWDLVEAKLNFSGWTKVRAPATKTPLTPDTAFWYIKPGRPSGTSGGTVNQDYFAKLSLLQDFCVRAYGWELPVQERPPSPPRRQRRRASSRIQVGGGAITPEGHKTKPQDPGKPLLDSPFDADENDDSDDDGAMTVHSNNSSRSRGSRSTTSSCSDASLASRLHAANSGQFGVMWSHMRRRGWRAYKGDGLVDWVYCRPGVEYKKNNLKKLTQGVDYFLSSEAVMEYYQRENSGKDLFGSSSSLSSSKKQQQQQASSKRKSQSSKPKSKSSQPQSKKQKSTNKRKRQQATSVVSTVKKPAGKKKQKTAKSATAKATVKKVDDAHSRKTTPVPSSNDVWPLLQQLKFSMDSNGHYRLPGTKLYSVMAFKSLQAVRTFLCQYGVPGGLDCLCESDRTCLEHWIKFANVPVTKRDSVAVLKDVKSPRKITDLLNLLYSIGCSSGGNGSLHLPHSDKFRDSRKPGIDYFDFDREDQRNLARIAIRGQLWSYPKRPKPAMLLQVALWAAMSSQDLPKFVDLPKTEGEDKLCRHNKELLEKLADLPPLVTNPEDEEPLLEEEALQQQFEEQESSDEASEESNDEADNQEDDTSEEEEEEDTTSVDESDDESQASSVVVVAKKKAPTKSSKQVKMPKRPTASASASTKGTKKQQQQQQQTTKITKKAQNKKQSKSNEPWWRKQPIPSGPGMWPLLERLGFSKEEQDEGRYHLPEDLYDAISFGSLQALRVFLCQYGIPFGLDSSDLSVEEETQLVNWIKFANVPVSSKDSMEKLANVPHPKTLDSKIRLLCAHGWESSDGKLFIPGCPHHGREKGVHYFDYGKIESDVRPLVLRKLWTYYDPNDEQHSQKQQREHLQLALWAATSEVNLPTFRIMPEREEVVEMLEHLDSYNDKEMEDAVLSSSDDDESSVSSATDGVSKASSKAKRKRSSATMVAVSASSSKPATVAASVPKAKKAKQPIDRRPFYIKDPVPSIEQVWPILEVLKFHRNGKKYSHPQLPDKTFSTVSSLRAFLVKERIPGLEFAKEDLKDEDRKILDHWVKWVHVGLTSQNSVKKMQDYKHPSDTTIHKWLKDVRIQTLNGEYHFPSSDSEDARQKGRVEGIHFVKGLDALRIHVRKTSDDELDLSTLSGKDKFLFRAWAASASNAPLPMFAPPPAPSRSDRSRRWSRPVETRKQAPDSIAGTAAPRTSRQDEVNAADSPVAPTQRPPETGTIAESSTQHSSDEDGDVEMHEEAGVATPASANVLTQDSTRQEVAEDTAPAASSGEENGNNDSTTQDAADEETALAASMDSSAAKNPKVKETCDVPTQEGTEAATSTSSPSLAQDSTLPEASEEAAAGSDGNDDSAMQDAVDSAMQEVADEAAHGASSGNADNDNNDSMMQDSADEETAPTASMDSPAAKNPKDTQEDKGTATFAASSSRAQGSTLPEASEEAVAAAAGSDGNADSAVQDAVDEAETAQAASITESLHTKPKAKENGDTVMLRDDATREEDHAMFAQQEDDDKADQEEYDEHADSFAFLTQQVSSPSSPSKDDDYNSPSLENNNPLSSSVVVGARQLPIPAFSPVNSRDPFQSDNNGNVPVEAVHAAAAAPMEQETNRHQCSIMEETGDLDEDDVHEDEGEGQWMHSTQ